MGSILSTSDREADIGKQKYELQCALRQTNEVYARGVNGSTLDYGFNNEYSDLMKYNLA